MLPSSRPLALTFAACATPPLGMRTASARCNRLCSTYHLPWYASSLRCCTAYHCAAAVLYLRVHRGLHVACARFTVDSPRRYIPLATPNAPATTIYSCCVLLRRSFAPPHLLFFSTLSLTSPLRVADSPPRTSSVSRCGYPHRVTLPSTYFPLSCDYCFVV